jgi:PAS domain S-box-containing protein
MNPAAMRLFELDSLEEALKMPHSSFFTEESFRYAREHRELRQDGEADASYEVDMLSVKKSPKRVRITPLDVYDRTGRWLSTLVTLEDISAQYLLSQQLTESEDRFQALVETSVAGIWHLLDRQDLHTVYMNPAMLRLLEIESLDAALRLKPSSFFTEEMWKIVSEERKKRARGEGRSSFEVELLTTKGNRRWAFVSPVDIYDRSGVRESTIVTYIDITEQHYLQSELQEREQLYETLTENTITPIWHTKPDGTTIYMNQAAVDLLELESVEAGAHVKVEDIMTPESDGIRREQIKNRPKGEASSYELEIQTKKGNNRYVHISAAPLINEKGEWLSSIATFVDLTEQKAKEREREKNLAMFEALVVNMPEGILVEDPNRRLVAMNDILLSAFGMEAGIAQVQALAGPNADGGEKYVGQLTTDPEGYAEFIRSARATSEPILAREIEFRDGRTFETDYVPIHTPDGNFIAHFWKYRETTEQKKVEQELVDAKERAEEMNRLKSSFLANMSHEIRTPMTAIQGFASLIAETTKEADTLEFSERILTGGRRLLNTINDILNIARIEANRVELNLNPADLALEVENTIRLLYPLSDAKHLRLRTNALRSDVFSNLDSRYFGQIITNLVSNAIKFTERGEITVEIDSEESENPNAIIRVKDTGIGIHPDSLRHLFDEFWQESQGSGRRFEGTGLGLAIVKKLTELMSGQISVESTQGKGTTFTLRFPVSTLKGY